MSAPVGARPTVTCWINDLKIAQLDMATLTAPNYDAEAVAELLGTRGQHRVRGHGNDPRFGERRWGKHAACRWRNIRIREL